MRTISTILISVCCFLSLNACGGSNPLGPLIIKGAGATAPNIAYNKWVKAFTEMDKGATVEYEAVGSGEGVKRFKSGSVDFAGTDVPLTDAEIAAMPVKPLHFPTLVEAVVAVYSLPDMSTNLQLSGPALAGIFAGTITKWNDPLIAKLNPGLKLPAEAIKPVTRSDASGTTYNLTAYFSAVSPQWKVSFGTGEQLKFPVGEAVAGNEAVAAKVKSTPFSIGYVESNFARKQKLAYASVENAAGRFMRADLSALGQAVGPATMKDDFRASIINSSNPAAYPICSLTWILVPSQIKDGAKKNAIQRFLRYVYTQGLDAAMPLDYGILQGEAVEKAQALIESIH